MENFSRGWDKRWVHSEKHPPGKPFGRWQLTAGSTFADLVAQRGLKTMDKYRNYATSAKFQECVTDKTKPLIVQYVVKMDRPVLCGGLYIKLLGNIDQKRFTGGTPYHIMFGPDMCFAHTHFVKFLISRNGTNFNMNQVLDPMEDGLAHLYRLWFFGNQTFQISIDGDAKHTAYFSEEFDYEGPKYIHDPYDKRPNTWDEREWVIDESDKKPDDWDDQRQVPNLTAQPHDKYNPEIDGEWKPPLVDNPNYKGVWKPREIPNPNYMGIWRPRKIPNPDYSPDEDFGRFDDLCTFGIEVHQDNYGSIFSNMLVTDDIDYANEIAEDVFFRWRDKEGEVYRRWGGKERWETQRDWGILNTANSKDFGKDEHGNVFGDDQDAFYKNTHKQKGVYDQSQSLIAPHSFKGRDDL